MKRKRAILFLLLAALTTSPLQLSSAYAQENTAEASAVDFNSDHNLDYTITTPSGLAAAYSGVQMSEPSVFAIKPQIGSATVVKTTSSSLDIPINLVNQDYSPTTNTADGYDNVALYTWEFGNSIGNKASNGSYIGFGSIIVVEDDVISKVSLLNVGSDVPIPSNGYVLYMRHINNQTQPYLTFKDAAVVGRTITTSGAGLSGTSKTLEPNTVVAYPSGGSRYKLTIDEYNKTRATDKVTVYTSAHSSSRTGTTGAATASIEIVIQNDLTTKTDKVVAIGASNSTIPEGGYVISFTGDATKLKAIQDNFKVGDPVRTNITLPYIAQPKARVTKANNQTTDIEIGSINPSSRAAGVVALYKPEFNLKTGTATGGKEIVVKDGKVVSINTTGNSDIPARGFVLSVSDTKLDQISVGDSILLSGTTVNKYIGAAVSGTKRSLISLSNATRPADKIVIYTPEAGKYTSTGYYGVEIAVSKVDGVYKVSKVVNGLVSPNTNNTEIPSDGFVLSVIDTSGSQVLRQELLTNFPLGAEVTLEDMEVKLIKSASMTATNIDPAVRQDNTGELIGTATGTEYSGGRGANHLVVYTPSYGHPKTGTNSFGTEVTVVNGVVTEVTGYNSTIPANGFVVSGHGTAKDWITNNFPIGSKVTYDRTTKLVTVSLDHTVYIEAAEAAVNFAQAELDRAIDANRDIPVADARAKIANAKQLIGQAKADPDPESASRIARQAKEVAVFAFANTVESNQIEMRGVWHRPVEKTVEMVDAFVKRMADSNFNVIFLETFYHGFTIYPSAIADQRPEFNIDGFDIMAEYVKAGNKYGVEIHAWVEDFYVGHLDFAGKLGTVSGSPIIDRNPTWAAKMKNGGMYLTTENGYMFMNAAMPEVQDFLSSVYQEIVTNYEVKGLQLDYIRYPVNKDEKNSVGYDDYSKAQIRSLYGFELDQITKAGDPAKWQQFSEWKASNVTNFVQRISQEISEAAPHIQISTAVFGNITEALESKNQNWPDWISRGYLDFISPMAYLDVPDEVKREVKNMVDRYPDINNYAGISPMYHRLPIEETVKQIVAVREAGAKGVVFFDSKDITDTQIQILKEGPFRNGSTMPVITRPQQQYDLQIVASNGGTVSLGSSGSYASGAVISLVATADSGYVFSGWTTSNGGTFLSAAAASTTFTMPANATVVTAHFELLPETPVTPTPTPTTTPTTTPTDTPTTTPTTTPTDTPTTTPTTTPTDTPTTTPTTTPTDTPTATPTTTPTATPTTIPTAAPTEAPSTETPAPTPTQAPAPVAPIQTPQAPPTQTSTSLESPTTIRQLTSAKSGDTIVVEAKEKPVVTSKLLSVLKGKDINLVIEMPGYSWTINGNSTNAVPANSKGYDLKVSYETDATISTLANDKALSVLDISHDGDFPFTAIVLSLENGVYNW